MKRVFVDTGGFFALMALQDSAHPQAAALFAQSERERWQLVTTNAVVYETHALLLTRARSGRDLALEFVEAMVSSRCRVERVTKTDEAKAVRLLRDHRDKGYSLCDAVSFVVMGRLRITEAISFDRHFREYGRFLIL